MNKKLHPNFGTKRADFRTFLGVYNPLFFDYLTHVCGEASQQCCPLRLDKSGVCPPEIVQERKRGRPRILGTTFWIISCLVFRYIRWYRRCFWPYILSFSKLPRRACFGFLGDSIGKASCLLGTLPQQSRTRVHWPPLEYVLPSIHPVPVHQPKQRSVLIGIPQDLC